MRFLGIDLSLNHGAFMLLDGRGVLVDAWFVTGAPKEIHDSSVARVWELPKRRKLYRDTYDLVRLKTWKAFIRHFCEVNKEFIKTGELFAAIEGYAFGASSSSTYQIGGLGEAIKIALLERNIPLRIYDPQSIKMFVTGKGNASAQDVWRTVIKRFNYEPQAKGHPDNDKNGDAFGDLCTGLSIAKLVRIEWLMRNGKKQLDTLDKPTQHIFKKSTKTMPIPILDRDWTRWVGSDFRI